MHWEPEEEPTAEQWEGLERLLAGHPARWMAWEGAPDPATVTELKTRGLRSVVFDPCGNVPDTGDYLSVMGENAAALEAALSPENPLPTT